MASIENNAYLLKKYGEHILIPEGGFSLSGMEGATSIATYYTGTGFSHICIPIGTGTSLAGILKDASGNLSFLGFPALKGLRDIQERLHVLGIANQTNVSIKDAYHFGGFGKYTNDLITFLNNFYEINSIPLDFVYTGKMMFGIQDLLKINYFPAGSEILCIHTGGLQGNSSIKDRLIY